MYSDAAKPVGAEFEVTELTLLVERPLADGQVVPREAEATVAPSS